VKVNKKLVVLGLVLGLAGIVAVATPALAHGRFGGMFGGGDRGERLAEALGISLEELQQAQMRALEASLEDAVASGHLTEEEAALKLAEAKLRNAIDERALVAEALGIGIDELEAAQEGGKSFRDLLDEMGIDRETFQANLEAAREKAIAQAVADGVITQEQADALAEMRLGGEKRGGHGMRGGPRGEMPGGERPGGERPGRGGPLDDTSTDGSTDSSTDTTEVTPNA